MQKHEAYTMTPGWHHLLTILNKQKFDVIGLWHVLEHVPNPEETISQLIQALNPEGSLFLTS